MIVTLENLIFEYSYRNKKDENIPVYSVSNEKGFCTGYFSKEVASKDKKTYKIVPKGYFAYNPSRINVGSIDWQRTQNRVIVSPLYVVFGVSERLDNQYLLYYLKSDIMQTYIKEYATGSVRDNLKLSELMKFPINLRSLEEQKKITLILDKINELIFIYSKKIEKLDQITKSRFIETFGDPVMNPKNWKKQELGEIAYIKIGPFGSLLHKEEYCYGKHPLINPINIKNEKIFKDNNFTVDDKKYNELFSYHLKIGDIVMGRRGEMGRSAVVLENGLLCGTGSILIRPKKNVRGDFVQKIVSFPTFKKAIEDMAVGQTMPNLNVPIVSKFRIIMPPMDVQNEYYSFVEQTDKSKLAVQKSLEKLETLKKSLMQEYFG